MLSGFQWFSLITILLIAFAGGYAPLFKTAQARREEGFPLGEAFAAGIFLALCLTMMLPSAFTLFHKASPTLNYPIAALITIAAFLILLGLEHLIGHLISSIEQSADRVGAHTMIVVKAVVLSLAAGTFLYMGTMHELRHSPLIRDCARLKGFLAMLAGLVLTALVRFLIGEAHRL